MKEKDIQNLFGKKIKALGAYELKIWKGPSFPFDAVEPHQERSLLAVEDTGLYHKISDYSPNQKPFDCFYLIGISGYVVVVRYVPRETKMAYCFRIKEWLRMKELVMAGWNGEKPRKSITIDHAKYFASGMIDLR